MIKVILLTIMATTYAILIIMPNYLENRNYESCVADSITEQEATLYNYGGNIRNDESSPKTCRDGKSTYEERSLLVPSLFR